MAKPKKSALAKEIYSHISFASALVFPEYNLVPVKSNVT